MLVKLAMLGMLMCVNDANAKCSSFKVQSNGTKMEKNVDSITQLKNVSLEECCQKCKETEKCRSFMFDKSATLCYFYQQHKSPHNNTCISCVYGSLKTPNTTVNSTPSNIWNWKLVAIIVVSFIILVLIVILCCILCKRRKISGVAKGKIQQPKDCKFDGKRLSFLTFDENVDIMKPVILEEAKVSESDTLHGIPDIEIKSFEVDEERAAGDIVEPAKDDVTQEDFNKPDENTVKSDLTLKTFKTAAR